MACQSCQCRHSAPRVAVTSLRLRRLPSAAQAPKTRPPPPAVSARLPIRGGEHGRAATHGRSRLRVGTRCCRRRGSDHRAAAAAVAAATDCHALHGPVASPAARCGTLRPVRRAPGAPRGGGRAPAPPPLPRWPPTAAHAVEDTPGGGAAGGWMVAAASRATAAATGPGGWMTWSRRGGWRGRPLRRPPVSPTCGAMPWRRHLPHRGRSSRRAAAPPAGPPPHL